MAEELKRAIAKHNVELIGKLIDKVGELKSPLKDGCNAIYNDAIIDVVEVLMNEMQSRMP